LDKAGVSLKQAMQLARHSDPKLTIARYGRAQLHDLSSAVDCLPALASKASADKESLRATGTDGTTNPLVFSCPPVAQTDGSGCERVITPEKSSGQTEPLSSGPNPLETRGFETERERLIADDNSAPCRTRTYNPLIGRQPVIQPCSVRQRQRVGRRLQEPDHLAAKPAQINAIPCRVACYSAPPFCYCPSTLGSVRTVSSVGPFWFAAKSGSTDQLPSRDPPGAPASGGRPWWSGPRRPRR